MTDKQYEKQCSTISKSKSDKWFGEYAEYIIRSKGTGADGEPLSGEAKNDAVELISYAMAMGAKFLRNYYLAIGYIVGLIIGVISGIEISVLF